MIIKPPFRTLSSFGFRLSVSVIPYGNLFERNTSLGGFIVINIYADDMIIMQLKCICYVNQSAGAEYFGWGCYEWANHRNALEIMNNLIFIQNITIDNKFAS